MYIGKLDGFDFKVSKINRTASPKLQNSESSLISIKWDDIDTAGIDVHAKSTNARYVSTVAVQLGKKCEPQCIRLYSKDKSELLYEYHGETGKAITEKEIALSAERELSEFVIEFTLDFTEIDIESIDIYGADFEGEQLYPTPQKYTKTGGVFDISHFDTVSTECEAAKIAVNVLKEKLYETSGITLKDTEHGKILFKYDGNIKQNGYALTITKDGATVKAQDGRGFVQGVETLIKQISKNAECCDITDEPFCEFRGIHLMLPAEDQMDFAKRLIKYMLSPLGYNNIILELAGAMEYESHPEINRAFNLAREKAEAGEWPKLPHSGVGGGRVVSKKSIRDFVDYARSYGIEVIPEIQSLGHVQFMTLAHPEIAEISNDFKHEENDERNADTPPNEFYAHSFCPSNPKSYEILFDLAEEIIETIKPKEYVHMGHDEVYQLGICPKCKNRVPSEIFAEDINKLHGFLAKKGLKMMIWGDMLQSISKYKIGKYKCFEAMDKIPKDIVLLDFIWYFFPDKDIEDTLLPHGFDVIYGNMYSSHFPRYETRIRKKGIIGAQTSTWVTTKEDVIAREGKFYDIIYTAQMLWSDTYSKHLRYSYDKVISGMIPKLREQIKNIKYPSLREGSTKIKLDLCNVKNKFDSIIFEHTASEYIKRIPWVPLEVIANYTVSYKDGTKETVPVTYGGNIGWRYRRHNEPFSAMYYRHNGYTSTWETDGKETKDGTVYCFEWINPKPDCEIASIVLDTVQNAQTQVIINDVYGIK